VKQIDLDEWGYHRSGSIDMYTHDSGTAQIRVHHQPAEEHAYHITFEFEGGDGIITVTASDATRVETWAEAEAAVRTFVEYFDTEIDERYYTSG
jgi:hypothetical protein